MLSGIGLFIAGTVLFSIAPGRWLNMLYGLFAAGSVLAGLYSLGLIMPSAQPSPVYVFPVSGFLELAFQGNPLSGYFSLLLSVLGAAVSVYSIGYMKGAEGPRFQGIFYGLFLLSLYAVFFSSNIVAFLVAWEAMSLLSFFLVVSDTRDEEAQAAGITYATMTHIGTAFIIAAFMAGYALTGSLDFQGIRAGLAARPEWVRSLLFVLSFIGFGMKAGIVPLHIWLPRAHPAAPSNVSALMSGVMIKAGLYGMIMMGIGVLGGNVAWWGILALVAGGVSSVMGILYALMARDIKRLLAYSSVENIGIMLLGFGASIMFYSFHLPALAGIALAACLCHAMNHAVFKGMLFMGAGSVMHAVHSKNMEEMGGLLKKMPWTGLFFLVGAVSICALPPFNGFVSEWLTFQSLVLGSQTPAAYSKVISLLGGAALALTGAFAAAAFIKAFGISFLGMPRHERAEHAKEAGFPMTAAMGALALLCLLLGVYPGLLLGLISRIPLGGLSAVSPLSFSLAPVSIAGGFSGFWPAAILSAMLLGFLIVFVLIKTAGASKKTVYADSWDCGIRALTPRMQYTATAFTKPVRVIFKSIYLPRREIRISYRQKPFFAREITYRSDITPFIESYIYRPLLSAVHWTAHKIRHLQSGSLHLYLGYIMITLITLLLIWG